jgi:hypothetical protein
VPDFLKSLGQGYPFDLVCICSVPNFLGVLLHLLIVGLLVGILIKHVELRRDSFFTLLLSGVGFSTISKILDWYMNMRTATGYGGVFFSFEIDVLVASMQFIGIAIIFYAIITKLFYIHHERESTT